MSTQNSWQYILNQWNSNYVAYTPFSMITWGWTRTHSSILERQPMPLSVNNFFSVTHVNSPSIRSGSKKRKFAQITHVSDNCISLISLRNDSCHNSILDTSGISTEYFAFSTMGLLCSNLIISLEPASLISKSISSTCTGDFCLTTR